MDDLPCQFRQQPIPPEVPDFQLNKPRGKIFGEAIHGDVLAKKPLMINVER